MTPNTKDDATAIQEALTAQGYKQKRDSMGRTFSTLRGKHISQKDYTRAWIDVQLSIWRKAEGATP